MKYLNALNKIEGVGAARLRIIMDFFGTPENAWKSSKKEFIAAGLSENLAEKIMMRKSQIDVEEEWEMLQRENIKIISAKSEYYPPLLKEISDYPYVLYAKGDLSILKMAMIAIVGSRKYTSYGKQIAENFSRELSGSGLCIVSGLAIGIDSIAHKAALEAEGKTIAIIGSSIDDASIYPRTNLELSRQIINSGGAVLSEYPVPTKASEGTFPARNRIMAGISLGTVVVEAGLKSGTLITANLAAEYGREVFAVPGSIFYPQSEGSHKLIKSGAKLITSVADVLEEIRFENKEKSQKKIAFNPSNENEKIIYNVLTDQPTHIDIIIKQTKLETMTVSSTLSLLEIKGVVKNIGAQNYIKL